MAYVIEDDSDDPFIYTKYLAELYKTRLKELGDIEYISLSWLNLQMLVLQLFHLEKCLAIPTSPFFHLLVTGFSVIILKILHCHVL